jgi:hypothetical protein
MVESRRGERGEVEGVHRRVVQRRLEDVALAVLALLVRQQREPGRLLKDLAHTLPGPGRGLEVACCADLSSDRLSLQDISSVLQPWRYTMILTHL